MGKKRILLIDMYGVIIKESKGYFIPYTFAHFEQSERNLSAAQEFGINTILFNRDNEIFSGNKVENFQELDDLLKRTINSHMTA